MKKWIKILPIIMSLVGLITGSIYGYYLKRECEANGKKLVSTAFSAECVLHDRE